MAVKLGFVVFCLTASAGVCFVFGYQRNSLPVSSGGMSSADISAPVAFLPELLFSITTSNMYFSHYFA